MAPEYVYLDPRQIQADPHNSRTNIGDLAGLAQTIRSHGLLQPVGIRPDGRGYRVVYGNRRREAAILAGLERIPCLVLDEMGEEEILIRQLLENVQRLDLDDLDKARSFRRALEAEQEAAGREHALDRLSVRLGLSTRQIQRYLSLLELEPEVQAMIELGDLGVTQAQHLRAIEPAERQVAIATLAVKEQVSAAELSRLCRALDANPNIPPGAALARLRQGQEVADVSARPRREAAHLPPPPPTPRAEEEEEEGDEEEAADEEGGFPARGARPGGEYADTNTRDGNRVRKFHSLDSFVDEMDRLALCVREGDLARLCDDDPVGVVKLKLAARQARYLAERLAAMTR